jgi:signal transduction histidine kinase
LKSLVEAVGFVNLAFFSAVALVALRQWRRQRSRAGVWAAATFGVLALVIDVGRLLPRTPDTDVELVAQRLLLAALVLFPYLLYRFTAAFGAPTARLERYLGVMTAAMLVWTFLVPEIPAAGEPRPAGFIAYLVGFLVHWTVLTVVVAVRLWRAGAGQPSVARRRMRMLAFASAAITVALVLAAPSSDRDSELALASALLASVSALAFLIGLAPPRLLRMLWRGPEQERLQDAIRALMLATTVEEVTQEVLPPLARIVGARKIALYTPDGTIVASYALPLDGATDGDAGPGVLEVGAPFGSLRAWASPYAPFFGDDEVRLLGTVGAFTAVALDRARLFAREHDARLALERADEVKTNFIALAAHELRSPVASAYGLSETMRLRGDSLSGEQRAAIDAALYDETRRMALLVEQLLDLSRLDAEAIPLAPERVAVRAHVEDIVRHAAGQRVDAVEVDVDPELEALVDPHALDRILSNLVANAFRYGAPPVTVSAERNDNHFRVAVEDHGEGVKAEFVPALFERFSRSDDARKKVHGAGLGLAIARSFARAHGGDLLYSHTSHSGARFEFVLPVGPLSGTTASPN